MKIFLDTAHIPSIKTWAERGVIDGVTTNPSLLNKEGSNPSARIREICAIIPHGAVSVEVTERDPQKVYKQAKALAAISENIFVKIPCHAQYYGVIERLVEEGVLLNITLVFSVLQGLMMCKLDVDFISPFMGRLDDSNVSGVNTVRELCDMIKKYEFFTEVIAASVRDVNHFHQAIQAGAHAITVPPAVLEEATKHPLTDAGIESFLHDWEKLGIKQFP